MEPSNDRKLAKGISWVEDREQSKLKFGPPLFDETAAAYNWRRFKQGFVAGKQTSLDYSSRERPEHSADVPDGFLSPFTAARQDANDVAHGPAGRP